jgi:hypothetical protein
MSSWNNLSLDIFSLRQACILPYFSGRRIDLELNNKQLKKLAEKIQKTCKWILVSGVFFTLLLILFFITIFKYNT